MRDSLNPLLDLEKKATSFDFYAALRQIECAHPEMPRIGMSLRPQDDAVRFGQRVSLAFEPAMIAAVAPGHDGAAPRVEINFFGLFGANGPLPMHLTEYARDRLRNSADPTWARFIDIFHHRLISLLYRAWAGAQPTVALDRPREDRFSDYVGSLIGIGTKPFQGRDEVHDTSKLHHAGRLAMRVKNAEGLVAILSDFFRVPVAIEQFVGRWMSLPQDELCRLHSGPDAAQVGMTTVLGKRVWNCQHNFRLVVGPIGLPELKRFLPGGDSICRLTDWVRMYAGLVFGWDVKFVLKRQHVPGLQLGRQSRLGWLSWLSSGTPAQDDSQLILNPSHHSLRSKQTKESM